MNETIFILLGLVGVWLVVLSVLFYLLMAHYNRLAGQSKQGDLKKVLEKVLEVQNQNIKEIGALNREQRRLEEDGTLHIQKIGLVKYNPFNETGGDHSFSLALLDSKNNGILLTGLHTREKTRIYVKSIEKGGSPKNLSEEEKKALAQANKK